MGISRRVPLGGGLGGCSGRVISEGQKVSGPSVFGSFLATQKISGPSPLCSVFSNQNVSGPSGCCGHLESGNVSGPTLVVPSVVRPLGPSFAPPQKSLWSDLSGPSFVASGRHSRAEGPIGCAPCPNSATLLMNIIDMYKEHNTLRYKNVVLTPPNF